jgi:Mrp family chromosome partitioning ATPase
MLAKRYKDIIVNAPPLLGVSDCHVLASHGDCVLIALEWGRTERSDAEAGAGVLRRLTTRLVFAVMTGVEIRGQQVQSSGLLTQKRFRRLYEG